MPSQLLYGWLLSWLRRQCRKCTPIRNTRPLCLEQFEAREVPAAISVAVVGGSNDDFGLIAIRDQLNNDTYYDFTATLVNPSQVDTVAELSAYQVVVLGDNGQNTVDFEAFAPALQTWVQGGGGVVGTGWVVYGAGSYTGFAVPGIDAVIPVNTSGPYGSVNNTLVTPNATVHPVTAGVGTFSTNSFVEYATGGIDSGATVLATANGQPVVVVGQPGAGRSVYLGPIYAGASGYQTNDLRTGASDRLLEQAVAWAAAPNDTTPPTVTGTTPALTNMTVGATSLQIAFSEPVTGATNPNTYELRGAGADRTFGTGDDQIVSVNASYTGQTATLSFAGLVADEYRLTVRSEGSASSIVGGSSLVTSQDLTWLESQLGEGPLTFTNIFTKTQGDGKSAYNFHQAADGRGRTISVMRDLYTGQVIGGYNPQSWNSSGSYNMTFSGGAFLFNLTTDTRQNQANYPYQTFNYYSYGPTFGGGHDIYVANDLSYGYLNAHSYPQNGLNILGTGGYRSTFYGTIEVFTISAGVSITDLAGNRLDGDANGTGGGDFIRTFLVNTPPVAGNDTYTTNEEQTLNVPVSGVLGNDSDADGQSLTAVLAAGPANGALTLNPDGSFTYTPNANFNGADSFTYRASDGLGTSNLATVSITVKDTATITGDVTGGVTEDASPNTVGGTLTVTDLDPGENAFQVPSPTSLNGTYGTFAFNAVSGAWTYTLNNALAVTQALTAGQQVTETLTVVSLDGTDSQDIVVTIAGVNEIEVGSLDVQNGQTQRSFVNHLDLAFTASQADLQNLITNGQIKLTRYNLDGTGSGVNVSLVGVLTASENAIAFNFGAAGIGGNANTTAGDGYYWINLDLDGDNFFETTRKFYRLLGDVNGDGQVTQTDGNLVKAAYNTTNPERNVNGDGIVNALDYTLILRSLNRKLGNGLLIDD